MLVATSSSTVTPRSTATSLRRLATSSGTSKCSVVMKTNVQQLSGDVEVVATFHTHPAIRGRSSMRDAPEEGAGEMRLAHARRKGRCSSHFVLTCGTEGQINRRGF